MSLYEKWLQSSGHLAQIVLSTTIRQKNSKILRLLEG